MLALSMLLPVCGAAAEEVRIKDIVDVEGVRSNQLIGYGLVVGLNQTGDRLNNALFTRESLISMLERLGVNVRAQQAQLQTRDIAAVMVTADLPAFAHGGSRIDVTVSATGDATDLSGGTLLVTPLMAANGDVYAVAQGSVVSSAFSAKGAAASVTRNIPTSARIANGAIVEREVPVDLRERPLLHLSLRNPDLTTGRRVALTINRDLGSPVAEVEDPRTISLNLSGRDVIETLARIEDLMVVPDTEAMVVVDEASGTIVMGDNVRISTVAIAQGNLTVQVTEAPLVSQPAPFGNGQTAVVPRTNVKVSTDAGHKLGILPSGPTLRDLVSGMNALGVGPRDMISILQTIKAAGALQANMVVR
ncbi:flagellar basal body P-ring protein FlgI [Endobacter medicaginis]|jgi:flagellar P-ring protein FlgI|nr:flagellar basal body P-ring protein FlgI [Endobacter medicaginis]MCX5475981.1 flagellar basal body P-ring protein FlgI [Endobacter medicaginis]NVN29296.1 flagellar basal body P-ring protein FlgI [Endobacter medicaginis]